MASLYFKGKSAVWNHHLSVPYHTLDKDNKKSLKGSDDSENLIIKGDNLLALKSLLPKYQGKVKCIYIDPPYNTGNENWVYNDNVNSPLIKDWIGGVVGKDDLTRHDKWLCMMTPRLKLLKELMSSDGLIFVSIDDNEQHRLRMLMDEIFGKDNFFATLNWTARNKPMNAGSARFKIQKTEEYIMVYGKMPMQEYPEMKLVSSGQKEYGNKDKNGRKYRIEEIQQRKNIGVKRSEKMVYEILGIAPQDGYRWTIGESTARELEKNGDVEIIKDKVCRRYYASEEDEENYYPLWANFSDTCGSAEEGKSQLQDILGIVDEFETVKPMELIKKILFHFTDADSIVLDSFAGSGTTAHAVLEANKEFGGNRKFVLVEMESYANSITAERVRKVVSRDKHKTGFMYATLGPAIDAETILLGKLPTYEDFAKYVFYLATGKNHPDEKKIKEKEYFVGKSGSESIYLLYKNDIEMLKKLSITLDWAERENKKNSGKKIVYAPACFLDDEHLEKFNIQFVSIPYNLFEKK